jgi:hypothetical protein
MARFCAEILANGSQCTQFARKGEIWCRAHADPRLRDRNAYTRAQVAWVADADLFCIATTLGKVAYELRTKLVQPLHAQAILDAVLARLDQITDQIAPEPLDGVESPNSQINCDLPQSSHGMNELQTTTGKPFGMSEFKTTENRGGRG